MNINFLCLYRLHYNSNSMLSERIWRIAIIGGCNATAALVSYSRIYLQYHSNSQVLCGILMGVFLGALWFTVTHIFLTSYFPIIVSW